MLRHTVCTAGLLFLLLVPTDHPLISFFHDLVNFGYLFPVFCFLLRLGSVWLWKFCLLRCALFDLNVTDDDRLSRVDANGIEATLRVTCLAWWVAVRFKRWLILLFVSQHTINVLMGAGYLFFG